MLQINTFTTEISIKEGVCLVKIGGYLSHGLSEKLLPMIEQQLAAGIKNFVVDLSKAEMIESPAVACILSMTEKIVEDSDGNLVFTGLSELHRKILEMVGIFLYASHFNDLEQAIQECKA
ncbi:MAG: hypothetical protein Kow0029_28910 [Candidatus Rifleibacteriota bacterium]